MSFTSAPFLGFVAVSLAAYYLLPGRVQWLALLAASYVFYLRGSGRAVVWLVGVTALTYAAALALGALNNRRRRLPEEGKKAALARIKGQKRLVVLVEVLCCFGLLYLMKYWNFTAELLTPLMGEGLPRWDFLVPMGLSYFIFQAVGYVIDVYRDKHAPERNPLKLALFTSFFPQMVQGPIGRYSDLAPQLTIPRRCSPERLRDGIQLAMWGYLKKMVVADRAAVVVDAVFADSAAYGGAVTAAAVFFYCIQLYCDFSGGIDITRGVACMFGVDMAENFRRPLFATSLTDYWRRWHITLGAWMRDYLFYPLSLSKPFGRLGKWSRKHIGGTAGKILPTSLATFIVYFVIGIWHGANFRYIAFGLWNGVLITASLLLAERFRRMKQAVGIPEDSRLWHWVQVARTALLVFIGRYITRAPRLLTAAAMLYTTVAHPRLHELWDGTFASLGLMGTDLVVCLLGMAGILAVEWYQEKGGHVRAALAQRGPLVQWVAMLVPLTILLLFGIMREGYISSEFIYTQF